jgi:hypothetical protein
MLLVGSLSDIGCAGELTAPKKVETTAMHDALVALLLMAIVMFPCFLSMETPS